jgi:hypothetical protein
VVPRGGAGFGAPAWLALGRGRTQRAWVVRAVAGVAVLTAVGLPSAAGVIGTWIAG